jgi:pimeloyl-ACP methyl ester carboxylesterase
MEHANVRDATLEYDLHGSGDPVLLIHGALVADGLRPLVDERSLADHFQLIVYHRRGSAGSDAVPEQYSLQDQAADAQALLGELGMDRAHVVGHSYGAAIALQLAADSANVVHSLALLEAPSTSVPAAGEFVQAAEPVAQRFASGDREGATDGFLTGVGGGDPYRPSLDRLLPGSYDQAVADSTTFFAVEFPALLAWNFSADDAKRIDAPVLRVTGERTIPWFSESDAQLSEWLPQSESVRLPGLNHLLQFGDPAPVAETLAGFFARHPMNGS